MTSRNTISIAILMALLTGCGTEPAASRTASPPTNETAPLESAQSKISVRQIDKDGLAAVISHLPGKVVLVDYWATWCPKCRETFSHSVELSRKFGSEGLVVISLACDDAGHIDEVLAFLREQNAEIQNLRSAFGSDEKTFEDFEIDGGALPHYKLFDRKGKLHRTFASDPAVEKQFALKEIDAAIEALLAAKSAETAAPPAPDQPALPEEIGGAGQNE
jgi:thiol-disulfide isomerase/thioredoxin